MYTISVISSLTISFTRVVLAWYFIGMLVFFLGKPEWAQNVYVVLQKYPFVPVFEVAGLSTAWQVQLTLLTYWTLPVLAIVSLQVVLAYLFAQKQVSNKLNNQVQTLAPRGEFYSVTVPGFSVGELPLPTVPKQKFNIKIQFINHSTDEIIGPSGSFIFTQLPVSEDIAGTLSYCNNIELSLCAEIVELLHSYEGHYAGAGHGVDLLEHTFNVVEESVKRCTPDFRLPLIAAFAHDMGKLITFQKDDKGEWIRKGYHSREGARILASLPSFAKLPLVEQRALILVLKYEHTFAALPNLGGDAQATALASRVLVSLTQADKEATAAEKDRNLEQMQPEDLLWKDFVDNIRNVPVLQMGKAKVKNQINHPRGHPYLYIYEVPWREGAIARLPEEVAAVLDLNRRDQGRIAKYTRIFTELLRKEGLLVESHEGMTAPPGNPLWNIRSGMMGKDLDMGQAINGVIAIHAAALWEKLNFRLSEFSDFNVRIESPNADGSGNVYTTQQDARSVPQLADKMSLGLSTAQVNKDNPKDEKVSKDTAILDRMDPKAAEQIGLVSADTLSSTQKTRAARRSFQTQDTSAATKALIDITKAPERKVVIQAPSAASKSAPSPASTKAPEVVPSKPSQTPVAASVKSTSPPEKPSQTTTSPALVNSAPVAPSGTPAINSPTPHPAPAPAPENKVTEAVEVKKEPDSFVELVETISSESITQEKDAPFPVLFPVETDEITEVSAPQLDQLDTENLLSSSNELEDLVAENNADPDVLPIIPIEESLSLPAEDVAQEDDETDGDSDDGGSDYAKEEISVAEENALPEQAQSPLSLQDIGLDEHAPAAVVTTTQASSEPPKLTFKTQELSVSEERNGIAIADRAVCAVFPHLKVGDKYYTTRSPLVRSGGISAGAAYNNKASSIPNPQSKKPMNAQAPVPAQKPATVKPPEPAKKPSPVNTSKAPAQNKPNADKFSFLEQKSSTPRTGRRF